MNLFRIISNTMSLHRLKPYLLRAFTSLMSQYATWGSKQNSRYDVAKNKSWEMGQLRPKNESQLVAISQPLTQFIRKSWFNLKPLNVSEFWEPVLTWHGLCFRFSLNNTGSLRNESVTRPGLEAGLGFLAFLNSTEYDSSVAFAGVRIFVTQPGTEYVNLAPFCSCSSWRLSIRWPAADRITDARLPSHGPSVMVHAPAYTQATCRYLCLANEIRATCNCRSWGDNTSDLDFCQDFDGCYESVVSGQEENEDLNLLQFKSASCRPARKINSRHRPPHCRSFQTEPHQTFPTTLKFKSTMKQCAMI